MFIRVAFGTIVAVVIGVVVGNSRWHFEVVFGDEETS